jgi:allantoinase
LWSELLRETDSVIKTVVSDHSPCTPISNFYLRTSSSMAVKASMRARKAILLRMGRHQPVGLGLSILWTEGYKRGTAEDVVKWCCTNTAKQVGLELQKGALAVGFDGDVAVFDDDGEFVVEPSTMLFRNKCSPYQGKTLKGVVSETWVRGQRVYSRATGFEKKGPGGQLLLEPRKFRA